MTEYHIDGRAGCNYESKCCIPVSINRSKATIDWYNIGGGRPLKNSTNIIITVSSLSQTCQLHEIINVHTVINSVNLCCTLSSPGLYTGNVWVFPELVLQRNHSLFQAAPFLLVSYHFHSVVPHPFQ